MNPHYFIGVGVAPGNSMGSGRKVRTMPKQNGAGGKKGVGEASSLDNIKIDPGLKVEAETILERLGLSAEDAVRVFMEQVVLCRGLPFEVRLPSPEGDPQSWETAWDEETERLFQSALVAVDAKYRSSLRDAQS